MRRGEPTRLIDWSALFIGLAGAVAAIALGVYTLHNPGGVDKTTAPAGMSFFFGAILLLATAGDIRMLARGAIEHRAGQIGIEWGEPLHPVQRDAAQAAQHHWLAVALKKRLVFADFFLDLVVIRQPFAANACFANNLAGGLALRGGIVEAVFGDKPRRRNGDFFAYAQRIEM